MNIVSQFKGKVKAYKTEKKGLGYNLTLRLENDEEKTFHCSKEKEVIGILREVGFFVTKNWYEARKDSTILAFDKEKGQKS